jgi:hypothetical protein
MQWWGDKIFSVRQFGNESLHETSKDDGFITVNLDTSRNVVAMSTMIPHRRIKKYSSTSPNGKNTHDRIDHVLIATKQQFSTLDVQSFREADMQRFDLRKLNVAEVKEQYQVEISNRFAALKTCMIV